MSFPPLMEDVVVQAWLLYLVVFIALLEFIAAVIQGHWLTVILMVVAGSVGYWAARRGRAAA